MDPKKKNVGTGLVGAPACGDVMKLQIEVDDNGKIIDAKFKTFGCGSAIASSSLATEWIKGKSVWKYVVSRIYKVNDMKIKYVQMIVFSYFLLQFDCRLTKRPSLKTVTYQMS